MVVTHLSLVMAIDKILILDEPTLGLDLVYRKDFYSQPIEDYYEGNKTILISTHQLKSKEFSLTPYLGIKVESLCRIQLNQSIGNT